MHLNKKLFIALFFLIVFASGCIQLNNTSQSPMNVIVIHYYYTENSSGIINMYGSGEKYTLFVPVSDTYQTIQDLDNISIVFDKYGNRKTTVNGPYNFSFAFKVGSAKSSLSDYPYPFNTAGYEGFLNGTSKIDSKNPKIVEISKNLTSGKTTALQVIGSISNWTNSYLNYTRSEPRDLDTGQILETRAGRCEEFARLYAAVARASGIPTRIVVGWVDTDIHTIEVHMWDESYVPSMGWVYVDPSGPEYGKMSLAHVKLYAGPDKLPETYYGNMPKHEVYLRFNNSLYECHFDKTENCTLSSTMTLVGRIKS